MASLSIVAVSSNNLNWGYTPDVLEKARQYETRTISRNRTSRDVINKISVIEKAIQKKDKENTRFEYINIEGKEQFEMHKKLINLDKIGKLQYFKQGWNGNNGLPFDITIVNMFSDIINNLDRQPDIAPTGRKSLQIQYELEDKSYLGFEIFADRITKLEVPKRQYNKAIVKEETNNFTDFINDSIRGFYGFR